MADNPTDVKLSTDGIEAGARRTSDSLDRIKASATQSGQSLDQLQQRADRLRQTYEALAQPIDRLRLAVDEGKVSVNAYGAALTALDNEFSGATRSMSAFERALQRQTDMVGLTSAAARAMARDLKVGADGADGLARAGTSVASVATALVERFAGASKAANDNGAANGNARMAMLELTHIGRSLFDQIAAGVPITRALTVEAGRMGQVVTEVGSPMGVLKAAAGAVSSALAFLVTPMGLAIAAAVALTAAVVAVGAHMASVDGQLRQQAETMRLYGDAAGLTARQLDDLARTTAVQQGSTVSSIREQETALLHFRLVGGDVFKGVIGLTEDYAAATGQTADKAVAAMGKAFSDPAKAARELHDEYGRLTFDQVEHIRLLQDAGDMYGAQKALLAAYTDEFAGSRERGLGPFGLAMLDLRKAAAGFFDEMARTSLVSNLSGALLGLVNGLTAVVDHFREVTKVVNEFDQQHPRWVPGITDIPGLVGKALNWSFGAGVSGGAAPGGNTQSPAPAGWVEPPAPGTPGYAGTSAALGTPIGVDNEVLYQASSDARKRNSYQVDFEKLTGDVNRYKAALADAHVAADQFGKVTDGQSTDVRNLNLALQGAQNALKALQSPEQELAMLQQRQAQLTGASADKRRELIAQWRAEDAIRSATVSKELNDAQLQAESLKARMAAEDRLGTSEERRGEAEARAFASAKGKLEDEVAGYLGLDSAASGTYSKLSDGANKFSDAQNEQLASLTALKDGFKDLVSAETAYDSAVAKIANLDLGSGVKNLMSLVDAHQRLSAEIERETGITLDAKVSDDLRRAAMEKLAEDQQKLTGYTKAYQEGLKQLNETADQAIAKEREKVDLAKYDNEILALEIEGTPKAAAEITRLKAARQQEADELARQAAIQPYLNNERAAEAALTQAQTELTKAQTQADREAAQAHIDVLTAAMATDERAIAQINQNYRDLEAQHALKDQLDALKSQSDGFAKSIDQSFTNMGKGIQDSISKSLEALFSGGIKNAKDFVTQLTSVLKTGLAQFASGIVTSGISSVTNGLFSSVSHSLGNLFAPASETSVLQQALGGGTQNANGTVTTSGGSTISLADFSKLGGLGGNNGGITSTIDNWAASAFPSVFGLGTPTVTTTVSAGGGLANALGVAPVAGGISNVAGGASNVATATGTAPGILGGSGIGASNVLGGIAGIGSGAFTLANASSTGGVVSGIGQTIGGVVSLIPGGQVIGPLIALGSTLLGSAFGGKVAAHDNATAPGVVDATTGKLGVGAATLGANGNANLVDNALTRVGTGLNGIVDNLGIKLSSSLASYYTTFGSAAGGKNSYNQFYGPDFIGTGGDSAAAKLAAQIGYQHQVSATDTAAQQKMADQVAFIIAKDPGSWTGLTDAMQRALKNSTATDVAALTSDLGFVKQLTDTLTQMKSAGGGLDKQIADLTKAANDAGTSLAGQITTNLTRVGQLLGADSQEYADTTSAAKKAVLDAMGLGTQDNSQLTGLALSIKTATLNLQGMQPALAALGYTADQQTQIINQAIAKATDSLRQADNNALDVADRKAKGWDSVDTLMGYATQRDQLLAAGSDTTRVQRLFQDQVNAVLTGLTDEQLRGAADFLTGDLHDMAAAMLAAHQATAAEAAATAAATAEQQKQAAIDAANAAASDAAWQRLYNDMAAGAAAAQQAWDSIKATIVGAGEAGSAAMSKLASDIKTYLEGLNLSAVSPLSATDRLAAAQQAFASGASTSTAQALLTEGKSYYGASTSDYAALYSQVVKTLAGVGAYQAGAAASAQDQAATNIAAAAGTPGWQTLYAQQTANDNAAGQAGYLASLGGVLQLAGARAGGGPVEAGSSYLIGERGPEIVTFPAAGRVWPNGTAPGAGAPSNADVVAELRAMREVLAQILQAGFAGSSDAVVALAAALNVPVPQRIGRRSQAAKAA